RERSYRYRTQPTLALRDSATTVLSPFEVVPFCHRFARRALLWVSPANGVPVSITRDFGGSESVSFEAPSTVQFEVAGDSPTLGYFRNERAGGSASLSVLGFDEIL